MAASSPEDPPKAPIQRFRQSRNVAGVAGVLLFLASFGPFYILNTESDESFLRSAITLSLWDVSIPAATISSASGLLAAALFVWNVSQRASLEQTNVPSVATGFSAAVGLLALLFLLFLQPPDPPAPDVYGEPVYWGIDIFRFVSPVLAIAVTAGSAGMWLATPQATGTERFPRPAPRATKICPDCAESVLSDARVCKHCGYRFEPAQ